MIYLQQFKSQNDFDAYVARLKDSGKIIHYYILDKVANLTGDGKIHNVSVADCSTYAEIPTTESWICTFTVKSNGSVSYNEYGSSVIATYGDPFNFAGFQIYSSKDAGFYKFMLTRGGVDTNIPWDAASVDVELVYKNGRMYVYMTDGVNTYGIPGGVSDKYFTLTFTADIPMLSYALPMGMNVENLKIRKFV